VNEQGFVVYQRFIAT